MRAFLFLLGCSIAGCSSSGGGGGIPLDGGVSGSGAQSGTGGTGGSGGTTTTPGTQTPTCARYVSCVAATNAAALGTVIDTYGPQGSCWAQGTELAQTCDSACVQALVSANEVHPEEPDCGECKTSSDCKDPQRPYCNDTTHRCTASEDPELTTCLNVLSCTGFGEGFVCAEKSCGVEYGACFGPGGKCASLMTCMQACGGCTAPGCIESCAEQGIPPDCYDECVNPVVGPLFDCMQSNFCGC